MCAPPWAPWWACPPPRSRTASASWTPSRPTAASTWKPRAPGTWPAAAPCTGYTRGDKFIQAPLPEHYDLQQDPDELNNLHDRRREEARTLEEDLTALLGQSDNQAAEGVAILQEAVDRTGDLFLVRSLAQARIIANDPEGALETLELFETLAPDDGRVFILRGDVLARQGQTEAAREQYRLALTVDPHRAGLRAEQRLRRLADS